MLILVNKFIQITDMKFNRLDPTTGKNADDMKLIYSNQVLLLHKKQITIFIVKRKSKCFLGSYKKSEKIQKTLTWKYIEIGELLK